MPSIPRTDTIRRAVSIPSSGIDSKNRTARVAFSSETPVRDVDGLPPVVLLHERDAADLDRLQSVLLNHDPDHIVGRAVDAVIDKDRVARATIQFDDDQDGQRALGKVRSGSLAGASAGFRIHERVDVDDGEDWTSPGGMRFVGPLTVATRWQIIEFSLTPVPADASVGIGRSEDRNMKKAGDDGNVTRSSTKTATVPAVDPAELKRVRQLTRFATEARVDSEMLDGWIESGTDIRSAREEVIDAQIATAQRHRVSPGFIEIGEEDRSKWARAAQAGLLQRTGYLRQDDLDFKNVEPEVLPLIELARECLRRAGQNPRGSTHDILHRTHSTSDFPAILESSLGKVLSISFREANASYHRWCRIGSGNRLNTNLSRVGFDTAPDLQENIELFPIAGGSLSDSKESLQIKTYARRFEISRVAVVNDDLSVFDQLGSLFGAAAARLIDTLAIEKLADNPTLGSDSTALFHANHNNLGSAAAPSVTTLGELAKLMRLQTSPNGSILNIAPRFILAPAALEATVGQVLGNFQAAKATDVTPQYIKDLEPIISARLDSKSTSAYYMLASPAEMPTIEVDFLDGRRSPNLVRNMTTDVLAFSWTCWIDVGVAALGYRGAAKNAGA